MGGGDTCRHSPLVNLGERHARHLIEHLALGAAATEFDNELNGAAIVTIASPGRKG